MIGRKMSLRRQRIPARRLIVLGLIGAYATLCFVAPAASLPSLFGRGSQLFRRTNQQQAQPQQQAAQAQQQQPQSLQPQSLANPQALGKQGEPMLPVANSLAPIRWPAELLRLNGGVPQPQQLMGPPAAAIGAHPMHLHQLQVAGNQARPSFAGPLLADSTHDFQLDPAAAAFYRPQVVALSGQQQPSASSQASFEGLDMAAALEQQQQHQQQQPRQASSHTSEVVDKIEQHIGQQIDASLQDPAAGYQHQHQQAAGRSEKEAAASGEHESLGAEHHEESLGGADEHHHQQHPMEAEKRHGHAEEQHEEEKHHHHHHHHHQPAHHHEHHEEHPPEAFEVHHKKGGKSFQYFHQGHQHHGA